MSKAAYNIDRQRDEARELSLRVSALYVRSNRIGTAERECPICGGHFAEQGRHSLSAHLEAAHADQILAMPAEEFK
jgi:hypothetical protein